MSATKSATLWTAYYAVCFAGFASLLNLARAPAPAGARWAPFAWPLILVAIAVMADRAEAHEPPPPPLGPVSVVTGLPTLPRYRPRTISAVGLTTITPLTRWVFPENTPPVFHASLILLMLGCAAFMTYVIPKLQPRDQ